MVPVSHIFEWSEYSEKARPGLFKEWAAAGAEHLVLSAQLLGQVMQRNSTARALKAEMAAAGLTFADAHALFGPYDDLCLPVEEYRPMMLNRHKLAIQGCDLMDVRTLTIHVGNCHPAYEEIGPKELIDWITRSLEELLPVAEKYNVIVCIENIWDPVNSSEALLHQIDYFKSPYLGICYDAGHAHVIEREVIEGKGAANYQWIKVGQQPAVEWEPQMLEKLLPHIVNCHLHDNHGVDDEHLLPGLGTVDWPHVMGLLAKAPRLQVIQNEVLPLKRGYCISELVHSFDELMKLFK